MARPTRRQKQRRAMIGAIGLLLATGGLGALITALIIVGPPPALRIDALWVRSHLVEVRLAVIGATVACLGTALVVAARSNRRLTAGLWLGTGAVLVVLAPRVRVIGAVVLEYFL